MVTSHQLESTTKKQFHSANRIDFKINFILVSTMIISGIVGRMLGDNNFVNPISLIAFTPLGPYQLISALIGSLNGNKDKRSYLIIALIYIIGAYVYSAYFMDSAGERLQEKMLLPIYAFPIVGAVFYTCLAYLSYERTSVDWSTKPL